MGSSQNQTHDVQRKQGPDILLALRESLIEDPRIGTVAARADGGSASGKHDDTAQKEFHHASSIAVAKPAVDQNLGQASQPSDGIPADSPSIAPMEPSSDLNLGQANLQSDGISSDRPTVGRRVFHVVARGFVVIAMVGAAFALLSYGSDKKKDIVRARDLSLTWLSSVLRTTASQGPEVAAASAAKPLDQTPLQNTAHLATAPGTQSPPASVAPGSSPEPQHQLETMANDLAVVRRLVEQLAARQDQMAQDIATLQAAEQNVSQKISSLPQSPIVRIRRKKVVKSDNDRAPVGAAQAPFGAY